MSFIDLFGKQCLCALGAFAATAILIVAASDCAHVPEANLAYHHQPLFAHGNENRLRSRSVRPDGPKLQAPHVGLTKPEHDHA